MIVLEANYAKKLGLPGFSSHQYSVSIRTELSDLSQVEQESSRLYSLLQDAVDESIQRIGYLPDAINGNANNGAAHHGTNGHKVNGHHQANGNGGVAWRCSDKQRELIERVVRDKSLNKAEVEQVAQDMFGCGVRALNRLQASGLIDELFVRYGGKQQSNGNHRQNIVAIAAQTRAVSKPYNGGATA